MGFSGASYLNSHLISAAHLSSKGVVVLGPDFHSSWWYCRTSKEFMFNSNVSDGILVTFAHVLMFNLKIKD